MTFSAPFKLFAASFFALLLSACNPMAQLDSSEEQIATFHATYNDGDARALYGATAAEFRDVTTLEQMEQLVDLVTDRMGLVQSTERQSFNINSENGTTVTVVTMTTVFDYGEAVETFTFQGSGDEMKLVGWNVDSPNFMEIPEEAVTEVEPAVPTTAE